MYDSILIATDGSENSARGVEAGIALARASGGMVTVVMVSEPFPTYDLGTRFGLFTDPQAIAAYDDQCRAIAGTVLGDARKAADAAGVGCETLHVENTSPAKAIIETAKARTCDLIVLTSHGRHGLERLVLGSTAARVVQSAGISVLVVR